MAKDRNECKELGRDIDFIDEIENRLEEFLGGKDVTQIDMVREMLSDWKHELKQELEIRSTIFNVGDIVVLTKSLGSCDAFFTYSEGDMGKVVKSVYSVDGTYPPGSHVLVNFSYNESCKVQKEIFLDGTVIKKVKGESNDQR